MLFFVELNRQEEVALSAITDVVSAITDFSSISRENLDIRFLITRLYKVYIENSFSIKV